MPAISFSHVSFSYTSAPLLESINLTVSDDERVCIIGPNGSGKSTLLRLATGELSPDHGAVSIPEHHGPPATDSAESTATSIEGYLDAVCAETLEALDRFERLSEAIAQAGAEAGSLAEEYDSLLTRLESLDAWNLPARRAEALAGLGLGRVDTGRLVSSLSPGQRARLEIAALLLSAGQALVLDEPTNHLDAESVQWLEQHLAKYPGAVLAVTHDRYFLDHVAGWICEVDRGKLYPYEGNYSTYLEKKAERLEVAGQKDRKLQKRLKQELEWVRSGAKARQAKSKARLARYEEMAAEAEKYRKLDFEEIQIPTPPRLGAQVVEVHNLNKGFDGRILIKDLSFTLPRNGIVGVIGPNGVGKTTLFKTIVGLEEPDTGEVNVGQTVRLSYVDQGRENIDPEKTVWEVVSDGLDHIVVGQNEMPSRAYLSAFGFKGADQQKPSKVLSGGERNRLNLALTLKQGGNLILLDEPTNDLDVETLSSLENALQNFPGCAVVISHDRWFLDRTCTHILAWEGNVAEGQWFWFEGNFGDYEKNKVERLGAEAARPSRVTHRKLTR